MFCPLSVDYGNVSDWVSGIGSVIAGFGSLIAVWYAVKIANSQRRYDQQLRTISENQAYEKRAHLIGEVIRLVGEIEAMVQSIYSKMGLGAAFTDGWRMEMAEVEPLRLQLDSLQQLATSDPQLFGEIGRISRECVFDHNIHKATPHYVTMQLSRMRDNLHNRRQALAAL